MKPRPYPNIRGIVWNLAAAVPCLLPSLALAHPGHYHPPGETDEFDSLRADFLHLHGVLEISIACLAVAAAVVFKMNRKRPVRIATAIIFGGSLAFLAAH